MGVPACMRAYCSDADVVDEVSPGDELCCDVFSVGDVDVQHFG